MPASGSPVGAARRCRAMFSVRQIDGQRDAMLRWRACFLPPAWSDPALPVPGSVEPAEVQLALRYPGQHPPGRCMEHREAV